MAQTFTLMCGQLEASNKLRQTLEDLGRTEARFERLKIVSDRLPAGKMPTAFKRYVAPYKSCILDDVPSPADGQKESECFYLDPGITAAHTKENIYMEYLAMQNNIDETVAQRQRDRQIANSSFKSFGDKCE